MPADVAVCVAAVADWRPSDAAASKIKKNGKGAPKLELVENPHILAMLSKPSNRRPKLVIGFAAETDNVVENAKAKRAKYGCDWILANDVATGTGDLRRRHQQDSARDRGRGRDLAGDEQDRDWAKTGNQNRGRVESDGSVKGAF